MNARRGLFPGLLMAGVLLCAACPAFPETAALPMNCQVIVSLMELDEDGPALEKNTRDITFYGAAAQKPYAKDLIEYGFETGVNVCMENDNNVLHADGGSSGGSIRVEIDNKLFLLDYYAGGYVALNLMKRLRLYAGAGPLLIYGSRENEPDANDDGFTDETDSRLTGGVYGRAGLEVAVSRKISIGSGVRVMATKLEFDDATGNMKVEGPQIFFNLSFGI